MMADNSISSHKAPVYDFQTQMAALHTVRKRILDVHSSIYDIFSEGDMDKREWCTILSKSKFCTLIEARAVFDVLDANGDGYMTPMEFQVGIESIAQIADLETLRKRLVCLGYKSMMQAITIMDGDGPDTTMQPLTLPEFATALKRVWVTEANEHRAIFDLVRDHADPTCRASLSDLACGLAVVSPCLLLEDLRRRMLAKHESLEEASWLLCPNGEVGIEEFICNSRRSFDVTEEEAKKLFRSIDLNGGGEVSHDELMRALHLAEASLHLEDVRRKLRQGYQTIQAAFHEAYAPPEEEDGLPSVMHFTVDELANVLRPINLGQRSLACLVQLMGIGDHEVTLDEFFSGIRLFAPSCVLEELKMKLLQAHDTLQAAFNNIKKDRRAPLNRQDFMLVLQRFGIQCDGEDEIFDVLDIRRTGVTTVSEMLAALQCLQSGHHKPLSQTECNDKVKSNIGQIFEPALRFASELKARVKEDAMHGETLDNDAASTQGTGRAEEGTGSKEAEPRRAQVPKGNASKIRGQAPGSSNKQPAKSGMLSCDGNEIPRHLLARRTFMKVTSSLRSLDSSESVLGKQGPLIELKYRRAEEYRIAEKLKRGQLAADRAAKQHGIHAC
jgi:Ca2+-binding EF-hand superfamily protein